MDISISSHVLNLDAGGPASGVQLLLSMRRGDQYVELEQATTDADGRAGRWQIQIEPGTALRLQFATGAWYEAQGQTAFYPQAQVDFVPGEAGHYHIPLLLNRHGYSTYRGS